MRSADIRTNSPLRHPPTDYCPPGSQGWLRLTEGLDAGKTLFYSDYVQGPGDPVATVVFVHGNPECSYTYRHVRDALIESGRALRLVAMDHIGFGLSDQADFEMVDMHHAANLRQLIRHLDLRDVTLVVHDWGGPIGVGAFIESPGRVRNLLVMNSTIFPMPGDGFTYDRYPAAWMPWSAMPTLVPDAMWGGVAGYVVSHGEPQAVPRLLAGVGRYALLHAARRIPPATPEYVWAESLRPRMNAKSSKRQVRQTPVWGHGYRYRDARHGVQDSHAFYRNMQARVVDEWGAPGRNIPACGYFGRWDACGKDSVIEQWQAALPGMRGNVFTYPDVGHFIEEYKGAEIAASIVRLCEANPA